MGKSSKLFILSVLGLCTVIIGCNKDNGTADNPPVLGGESADIQVQVKLPQDSQVALNTTKIFSLGATSKTGSKGSGDIKFNPGTNEIAYLLDDQDNLLLAGFVNDRRKEISVSTTVEVILYYALGYHLLPDSAKKTYLASIQQLPGFDAMVKKISELFQKQPLMFSSGSYKEIINEKMVQWHHDKGQGLTNRIAIEDNMVKSGITLSELDQTHIKLENSLPRRSKVFVYKKASKDKSEKITTYDGYDYLVTSMDFEPGRITDIEELKVGSTVSQVYAQAASIDNASSTDPIELPLLETEILAKYEVAVVGPGFSKSNQRALQGEEVITYNTLTRQTYVLDYFLPTLLDIGGNKALLPPFGSDKQQQLYSVVAPYLEAEKEVDDAVLDYDFRGANEIFLPILYEDVRLSNDLRSILEKVYTILSDNGTAPNTFIQSQELIKEGHPRFAKIMSVIDNAMNLTDIKNEDYLLSRSDKIAFWNVSSVGGTVTISPNTIKVPLGDATQITATVTTDLAEGETLEYKWTTSYEFHGSVSDLDGNSGRSITTSKNTVSYISGALETDLTDGDNMETVSVTAYIKGAQGQLSEIGIAKMQVNNQKPNKSFYTAFEKEVTINEHKSSLICGGGTEYFVQRPTYFAKFKAIKGARAYIGRVMLKNGEYASGDSMWRVNQLTDAGDGFLILTLGVGPIVVTSTCSSDEAQTLKQEKLDYLDQVGHQGVALTPIF